MAFSDYKSLAQVQQQFQVKYREEQFILVQSLEVSQSFLADFNFSKEHLDWSASEAARCEIIIFPILREVYKRYSKHCALWVQKPFSYDENLTGTPDYLFTTKSPLGKTVWGIPLLVIIEAKRNDFEQGWGQCLAELIAAQKINQDPSRLVYGIVTDGNLWQFGKLGEDTFVKQRDNYTIDELGRLFGAIDFVLQSCEVV